MTQKTKKTCELTENDVFFELFLPSICEKNESDFKKFDDRIVFNLIPNKSQPAKSWNLQSKSKPYVQRGNIERPDLEINLSEKLVKDLVHGKDTNIEDALKQSQIGMRGRPETLEKLGFIFESLEHNAALFRALEEQEK